MSQGYLSFATLSVPTSDRRLAWCIFLAVFSLYLLSSGREPPWGDSHGMYDVAEHLVTEQRIDISFPWPEDIPRGTDNRYYGITPIMTSLVHVPGVLVKRGVLAVWPKSSRFVKPITAHIAPAALGALTCVLFFLLCRSLGSSRRLASWGTVFVAVGTTTWVYARYPYSEVLQLACFTGFFAQTLRVYQDANRKNAIWLGIWAGLLVNTKYIFALSVLGAAVWIAAALWSDRKRLVLVARWACIGGLPFLCLAGAYNYARWGSLLETGYSPYLERYFGGSTFFGAWGTLFSPNKSIFLYSPPLFLAALGMVYAWKRWRSYWVGVGLLFVPVFLVNSTYHYWSGDYAWGARLCVFAVVVLAAPLVLVLEAALRWRPWRRRVLLGSVLAAGISVQVLGNLFYWDHYIRITREARDAWLQEPDRGGAVIPARGRNHCDSCFEDMYPIMWLPPFHPIKGHYWLFKSQVKGYDWQQAAQIAPWRRYTKLPIDISSSYDWVRYDWWVLLWAVDFPQYFAAGVALLIILIVMTLLGVFMWARCHFKPEESDP